MPRRAKGPRLWLRPARRGSTGRLTHTEGYFILDAGRQLSVGADLAEAERALGRYLAVKHTAGIGKSGKRDTDQIAIADVLTLYADNVGPNVARPHQLADRLIRLLEFFDRKTLADLNGALCREYAKRATTDAVARRDLEDLRAAVNHHRREGLHDRMVSVVLPPRRPARERWLTRSEAAALIWCLWRRGMSKHVARFCLVALYTGRRHAVVCGASFKREPGRTWIDTRAGFLRPTERAKQSKKRNPPIPLPARLLAHLRRWERNGARYVVEYAGKPVGRIDAVVRHAADEAGLGHVTPHVMRHTAASWMMMAGTDLFQASKYLGLSVQVLMSVYAHHAPEHLASAANAFERNRQRLPTNHMNR
jgi:integrase